MKMRIFLLGFQVTVPTQKDPVQFLLLILRRFLARLVLNEMALTEEIKPTLSSTDFQRPCS